MNIAPKIVLDDAGEAVMRATVEESQPEPAPDGPPKKSAKDFTRAEIEGYLADRLVELVGNYIKQHAERVAAAAERDVSTKALKRKLEAAPDAVKAQVAALLKDVVSADTAVVTKG